MWCFAWCYLCLRWTLGTILLGNIQMCMYMTVLVPESSHKPKQNTWQNNRQEQYKKTYTFAVIKYNSCNAAMDSPRWVCFLLFEAFWELDLEDSKVAVWIFTEFFPLLRAAWEKAWQLLGILKSRSARGQPTLRSQSHLWLSACDSSEALVSFIKAFQSPYILGNI